MKTLDEIESLSKEELTVELWDLIGKTNKKAEENLVEELRNRRIHYTTAETIVILTDSNIGFYIGRNDKIIEVIFHLLEQIAEKCDIKMETLLTEIIKNVKNSEAGH